MIHSLAERAGIESTTIRVQQEGPPRRLLRFRPQRLRAQGRYFTCLFSCIRLVHGFVGHNPPEASLPLGKRARDSAFFLHLRLSRTLAVLASAHRCQHEGHSFNWTSIPINSSLRGSPRSRWAVLVALPCGCDMHLRANTTGTSHSCIQFFDMNCGLFMRLHFTIGCYNCRRNSRRRHGFQSSGIQILFADHVHRRSGVDNKFSFLWFKG